MKWPGLVRQEIQTIIEDSWCELQAVYQIIFQGVVQYEKMPATHV
jgi:hypothetical protein